MLLLTPLYIRFLGVESYGLIGFYLSWIAILSILDTGISAAAGREIAWLEARPEEKWKIPVLLRSVETVYWGIVLILGLGILAGASVFGEGWFQAKSLPPAVIRDALMLMAISLVIQVPSGLYTGGLMSLQRQVECSSLLALFGTIRGFGAIIVLWKISPDIRAFFLWQIAASALQTVSIRWLLWKRVRIDRNPAKFSIDMLHSVKAFAGGMILITSIGIVMSQADKMILSRMVSLEAFGFYMLAWAVASGLQRIAVPLIQAFGPRFTELVSKGDELRLARQVRLASQLMGALILPPAALIIFLSKPILFVWTGKEIVAAGASQILPIMVAGTALCACSYPALSVLYSKKRLKPVVGVNLVSLIVLLPFLMAIVFRFGVIGAASYWALYTFILYISYRAYGLKGLPGAGFFSLILQDFIIPCIVSLGVAGIAGYFLSRVEGKLNFVILLGLALLIGWAAALSVCKDLFNVIKEKIRSKIIRSL